MKKKQFVAMMLSIVMAFSAPLSAVAAERVSAMQEEMQEETQHQEETQWQEETQQQETQHQEETQQQETQPEETQQQETISDSQEEADNEASPVAAFPGDTAQEAEEENAPENEPEETDETGENTEKHSESRDTDAIEETSDSAREEDDSSAREKSEEDLTKKALTEEALTEEALTEEAAAVIDNTAVGEAATSGECGDSLTWELDSEGTLTISGTGDMEDYYYGQRPPWYHSLKDNITAIVCNEGVTGIGEYAFYSCSRVSEITLPQSLQTIGSSAFEECTALKQIIIPSAVTALGDSVFSHCSSLTEAVLPENLKVIPYREFFYCVSLAKIEIPDSVTQINAQAFAYCRSISEITLPASLDNLEDEVFLGCINLKRVVLPENELDVGGNVFTDCADALQFLDRNEQVQSGVSLGEVTPAVSSNWYHQDYSDWNEPRNSYLVDEGTSRLRLEYSGECLIKEFYSNDGTLISRGSISMELPLFGGFFAGDDSYYLVFGQNNPEEDDSKEVIRIVKYSKEWVRQDAASICGENTTVPFEAGTVSLTETNGILYLRTSHQMYTSTDGIRHQANLTAVIRTSDMTVTSCFSRVASLYYGYVSHSFNQIIKSDGDDVIAADHGDAHPRGIILFRYAGKAGSDTLGFPENVMVFPFVGEPGENFTGASLAALEASSSHYLVAGNSVTQEEEDFYRNLYTGGTRNIFVTATPKDDFTEEATVTRWLTSYNSGELITTPVMTALPNDRFLLMWTVEGVLNYCFIAADGSMEGEVYACEGSLSDCQPYVKDNAVWWYVTQNSAPLYYYISLDDPGEVHVQNPGHTVVLDAMGGTLEADELEVVHGGTYGELPIPQREAGYVFLGWYTQKHYGTQISSDTSVRVLNSETLYARWERYWSFDKETGLLIIYEDGAMKFYASEWEDIRDLVKKVKLEEGVTSISRYVFRGFSSLTDVKTPSSLTSIETYAFVNCSSLKSITIPSGVSTIDSVVFYKCPDDLIIYGDTGSYAEEYADENGIRFIDPTRLEYADVTGISSAVYTGSPVTQPLIVKIGNVTLKLGTDYEVSYTGNTNIGTVTVTITGTGDYSGTVTKKFYILPGKTTRGDMFNLANNVKVTWKEVPGAKYYKVYREGVTDSGETLKDPVIVTDRLVGWDKEPGLTNGHAYRYKIVASLTGKGDPSGDSTLSYSKLMYRLKTVVIRSVKNTAPGKVTVKYDKSTSGDSYVLQYCERQDMVGAKTKVVLGANKTSFVIGGLTKGKTYYISIRVRKKVNGIDYYTTFGVAKKIKIVK